MVLLPEPEGPNKTSNSPDGTDTSIGRSASIRPGYTFASLRNSMEATGVSRVRLLLLVLAIPLSFLNPNRIRALKLLLRSRATLGGHPRSAIFRSLRLVRYVNHMLNFSMNLVKQPGPRLICLPIVIED